MRARACRSWAWSRPCNSASAVARVASSTSARASATACSAALARISAFSRALRSASLRTRISASNFLVVPDAPTEEVAQLKPNRRLGSGGIRLGILDNSKANADHLLNLIIEGVKKEFKVDSVVIKRKPTSSRPATDQILDELAQEADLVISAMAD